MARSTAGRTRDARSAGLMSPASNRVESPNRSRSPLASLRARPRASRKRVESPFRSQLADTSSATIAGAGRAAPRAALRMSATNPVIDIRRSDADNRVSPEPGLRPYTRRTAPAPAMNAAIQMSMGESYQVNRDQRAARFGQREARSEKLKKSGAPFGSAHGCFSLIATRFSLPRFLASRFLAFSLLASRFSLLASRFSLLASRFSLLAS